MCGEVKEMERVERDGKSGEPERSVKPCEHRIRDRSGEVEGKAYRMRKGVKAELLEILSFAQDVENSSLRHASTSPERQSLEPM